jgi:opacity protein-like surface antigen
LFALLAVGCPAGAALAQTDLPWDGAHLGINVGGASSQSCDAWSSAAATGSALGGAELAVRNCAASNFVGGLQVGDDFQYGRLLGGIGADLDLWTGKGTHSAVTYGGAALLPGSYEFSERQNPTALLILGPRLGYAGDQWLPYVRGGTILAAGSQTSALNFVPTGATKSIASFAGGKSFSTVGWVAGGGAEIGLNGAWSLSAEYLHANLGRGAGRNSACTGTGCAGFADIAVTSTHTTFNANIFRLGLNYWFGYWTPNSAAKSLD